MAHTVTGAEITFLTGGDVAPTRPRGLGMFGDLADLFRAADVSFVNLEHSLSTRGSLSRGREHHHRGPPGNADGLAEAGLSCVNLANNHILDYDDEGLYETLDELTRRDIPFFGAGADLGRAAEPCVIEQDGLRVGFLGYTTTLPRGFAATDSTAGVNPLRVHTAYRPRTNLAEYPGGAPEVLTWTEPGDLDRLQREVAGLAARTDVTLVYVHWGTSMVAHVHDFQREIGHAAVDAGAHGVFGGHQHVMCGIERYRGCPIVHGTGNLLFDKWEPFFTSETRKTFLLGATLAPGQVRDLHAVPVRTGVNDPPALLSGEEPLWEEIRRDLADRSAPFGTTIKVQGDRIVVGP